jgi:hypothetical protein
MTGSCLGVAFPNVGTMPCAWGCGSAVVAEGAATRGRLISFERRPDMLADIRYAVPGYLGRHELLPARGLSRRLPDGVLGEAL